MKPEDVEQRKKFRQMLIAINEKAIFKNYKERELIRELIQIWDKDRTMPEPHY